MKWYKHDANANCDAKLKKVRLKYGMEGYGLYWYCLELIAANIDKNNLTFELEHDAEIIAHDTDIHFERVQEMMEYMIALGLFEQQRGVVTCMKLAVRIENSIVKSPQLREIQRLIKESRKIPEKSGQNRIEQKRLEKENGRAPRTTAAGFDEFWAVYPKKRKKKTALEIWRRKKPDASALIADVRTRLAADKQWLKGFVPDPTTYLNGELWNDDMGDSTSAPKTTDDYALEFGITRRPDESDERFQVRVRDVMLVREGRT